MINAEQFIICGHMLGIVCLRIVLLIQIDIDINIKYVYHLWLYLSFNRSMTRINEINRLINY